MKKLTYSAAALFLLLVSVSLSAHAQTLRCTVMGEQLSSGQQLLPGTCLRSINGRYALQMQTNGDLALYDLASSNMLWDTGTTGRSVSYATIDSLGNLDLFGPVLVYTNHGGQGIGNYYLAVQNDGKLVTYKQTWSTNTLEHLNSLPLSQSCTLIGSLGMGQQLNAGSCLLSANTLFQLAMKSDGTLNLYDLVHQTLLWSTPTQGLGATYAVVETDGELALYNANNNVVWSNGVVGPQGSYNLVMRADGNANTYTSTWSTNTYTTPPNLLQGGNLDQIANWHYCVSRACNPTPPSQHQFSLGNVTPSLDGSAIMSYQGGSGYWGILYYFTNHLSSQDQQATNYSAEWSFQIDNVSSVQASEFDFPVVLNNLKFYFGTQCVPHGFWQYWDPNGGHWHNTGLRCTQITPGWHTLRWLGTRNDTQFTYSKLEIDGALYDVGIQINAAPRHSGDPSNGTMTVQYQADGRPNTAYHEYIDSVNAWLW